VRRNYQQSVSTQGTIPTLVVDIVVVAEPSIFIAGLIVGERLPTAAANGI
jgi:hypothetical protein